MIYFWELINAGAPSVQHFTDPKQNKVYLYKVYLNISDQTLLVKCQKEKQYTYQY